QGSLGIPPGLPPQSLGHQQGPPPGAPPFMGHGQMPVPYGAMQQRAPPPPPQHPQYQQMPPVGPNKMGLGGPPMPPYGQPTMHMGQHGMGMPPMQHHPAMRPPYMNPNMRKNTTAVFLCVISLILNVYIFQIIWLTVRYKRLWSVRARIRF